MYRSSTLQVKTVQNGSKHIGWWILIWEENLIMDLFLTNIQLFTSQELINWWTGVVCITCGLLWGFISCLDSHSDGTHSLQRVHWWTSDVISPNLLQWGNKLILNGLRVSTFLANLIFGWTIPLMLSSRIVNSACLTCASRNTKISYQAYRLRSCIATNQKTDKKGWSRAEEESAASLPTSYLCFPWVDRLRNGKRRN